MATFWRAPLLLSAGIFSAVGLYVGCQGTIEEIVPKPDMAVAVDPGVDASGGGGEDLGPVHFFPDIEKDIDKSCATSASCHGTGSAIAPIFISNATAAADVMANYTAFTAAANKAAPGNSDVLQYPSLQMQKSHGGGKIFSMTDPIYQRWLKWIGDGELP